MFQRAIAALRSPSSINHRIFRATMMVGVLSVLVKLIATVKELAVAAMFGRGDAVDAFLIAYVIPAFAIGLVTGSLNLALIPIYLKVREREGQTKASELLSSTILTSFLLMAAVTVVLAIWGPLLLSVLAHSFSPEKLRLTRQLFFVLLPVVMLNGITTNCGAALNASGRFGLAALTPLLTPLVSLALLLTYGRRWGILAVAVGFTLGSACETTLLVVYLARCGNNLKLRWFGLTAELRQVWSQYAPLCACCAAGTAVTIIDQTMASWLQPGSVAALSYGNRIVSVVVGLMAMSIGTAVIPFFSEMVAKNDWKGCHDTLQRYSWVLFGVGAIICVFMVMGSEQIVRILYQRGAFTAADSRIVGRVQAMYALQIPFCVTALLHVRLLTALGRNDLVLLSSSLNLVLDIILNLVCMRIFGVAGIALATSLYYVGSFIFALLVTRRLTARIAGSSAVSESIAA